MSVVGAGQIGGDRAVVAVPAAGLAARCAASATDHSLDDGQSLPARSRAGPAPDDRVPAVRPVAARSRPICLIEADRRDTASRKISAPPTRRCPTRSLASIRSIPIGFARRRHGTSDHVDRMHFFIPFRAEARRSRRPNKRRRTAGTIVALARELGRTVKRAMSRSVEAGPDAVGFNETVHALGGRRREGIDTRARHGLGRSNGAARTRRPDRLDTCVAIMNVLRAGSATALRTGAAPARTRGGRAPGP